MAAFLALVGFVVLILYKQIQIAFSANPGLNGLILGILAIGSLFAFRQVIRLFREIRWVNSLTGARAERAPPRRPLLLAPMAAMLNAGAGARGLSTVTTRAILNSIAHPPRRGARAQPLSRRAAGVPRPARHVLGPARDRPFDRGVIDSMKGGKDNATMFDDLKIGPVGADRRHERIVHLLAVRSRELADPGFSRPAGGSGAEPLLLRARGIPGEPCRSRRRSSRDAPERRSRRARRRSRRSSSRRTPRRSPRSPRAFRRWSAICAPSSSKSATGSTRRLSQQEDIGKLLQRLLDELGAR